MATVRLIQESEASGDVKAIYNEMKQRTNFSFVPDIWKARALNPIVLKQRWEAFKQAEDTWGTEIVHQIGLATGIAKGSSYKVDIHTASLKQLGYDDAKIESLVDLISNFNGISAYWSGIQSNPSETPATAEQKAMGTTSIPLVEEDTAPDDVKAVYNDIKQAYNLDFVPGLYKALAHQPDVLKQAWEGSKQGDEVWGRENVYIIGLTVFMADACSAGINLKTALLRKLGYDNAKLETLLSHISFFHITGAAYMIGLQLEPDTMRATMGKEMAA